MQEFASNNPYPVIDAQSLIADRTIELALENRKSYLNLCGSTPKDR